MRTHALALAAALTLAACGGSSGNAPTGQTGNTGATGSTGSTGGTGSTLQPPTGLTVTAAEGQVALSWTASSGATSYAVYYGTTAGGGTAGTRVGGITGTTQTVTGLSNDTTYHFAVTASDGSGESAPSAEVSAAPAVPGPFVQGDVTGTWRFSILSAGAAAGWKRGTLSVDGTGQITVASYLDESGATSAPSGFFPVLLVNPTGHVRDAPGIANARFTGDLGATNRKLIVATAASGGTASIAILQKHDPAVTFTINDVAGWGSIGGARKFVYDQLSTGASPDEWEFAAGQIGQGSTPAVQYGSGSGGSVPLPYLAPSSPAAPTNKISVLSVTSDGVVSEAINTAVSGTQPEFLLRGGFLSDDKTMIVAVGLGPNSGAPVPATGRHALRVYSVTNVNSTSSTLDTTTANVGDLAGSYAYRRLALGSAPLIASGILSIDQSGNATFGTYADSAGSTTAPASISFTMQPDTLGLTGVTQFWGVLSSTADATLNGKLSYDKDLIVFTQGTGGASVITFALK